MLNEFTRESILDAAKQIITQDRQSQYGDPEDSFSLIAKLWSDYLECDITASKGF